MWIELPNGALLNLDQTEVIGATEEGGTKRIWADGRPLYKEVEGEPTAADVLVFIKGKINPYPYIPLNGVRNKC